MVAITNDLMGQCMKLYGVEKQPGSDFPYCAVNQEQLQWCPWSYINVKQL